MNWNITKKSSMKNRNNNNSKKNNCKKHFKNSTMIIINFKVIKSIQINLIFNNKTLFNIRLDKTLKDIVSRKKIKHIIE